VTGKNANRRDRVNQQGADRGDQQNRERYDRVRPGKNANADRLTLTLTAAPLTVDDQESR
jgi:hypothetical protein